MPESACVGLPFARSVSFVIAPIEERSTFTSPLLWCRLSLSGSAAQSVI